MGILQVQNFIYTTLIENFLLNQTILGDKEVGFYWRTMLIAWPDLFSGQFLGNGSQQQRLLIVGMIDSDTGTQRSPIKMVKHED